MDRRRGIGRSRRGQDSPKPGRITLWIGVVVVAIISVGVIGRLWVANDSVQHVILISLDTARRDHFGCYGNTWIKTPNVDALARESILFTD